MNKLILLAYLTYMSVGTASATNLYGELNTGYVRPEIDTVEFKHASIDARLGIYLEPQIGLEAYYGTGLSDDTQLDIELSLTTLAGVNLRLESPESDGLKLYILLGYGMIEWEVDRSNTRQPGKINLNDFNYGLGFEWRLGKSKNWFVNIRGQRFLNKDNLSLDSGSLGVRYAF